MGAGGGERGPLLTSAPSAARWPRAPAPAARVRKAGSDATRRFVQGPPAVAPSDSAVNGNQPRGPERASSAGPQAQELCPDVPRVRALRLAAMLLALLPRRSAGCFFVFSG